MSMFKTNIISKVEVAPITQEQIEQLIIDRFKAENPNVKVTGITFTQRRDPARIEVTVDAQLDTGAAPVFNNQLTANDSSAKDLPKEVPETTPFETEPVKSDEPKLTDDEELDLLNLTQTPERVVIEDSSDEDDDESIGSIFNKG